MCRDTTQRAACGRYVADRRGSVRDAVGEWVRTWWTPRRDQINTDLGKMSDEELRVILHCLWRRGDRGSRDEGEVTDQARQLWQRLQDFQDERRAFCTPADLHPRMMPMILARLDHAEKPEPQREFHAVSYSAIVMLAQLRKDGAAAILEKVSGDAKQNSALRLTCILARHLAGDELPTADLLALLAAEKKLDRRVLAILVLGQAEDAKAADQLIQQLQDANRHVRAAAAMALVETAPPAAVPALRKMLAVGDADNAAYYGMQVLAQVGSPEAQAVLADYLRRCLNEHAVSKHLELCAASLRSRNRSTVPGPRPARPHAPRGATGFTLVADPEPSITGERHERPAPDHLAGHASQCRREDHPATGGGL